MGAQLLFAEHEIGDALPSLQKNLRADAFACKRLAEGRQLRRPPRAAYRERRGLDARHCRAAVLRQARLETHPLSAPPLFELTLVYSMLLLYTSVTAPSSKLTKVN